MITADVKANKNNTKKKDVVAGILQSFIRSTVKT